MVDQAAAPAPALAATAVLLPPPDPDEPLRADKEDASAAGAAPGERCRAMMEVVAKDGAGGKSKWKVSKLVVEHNHELRIAPGEVAATVPALGMEFDSVDAAKGFYYGYGERLGFKARTGSNRRSVGDGEKIMQRFLCWRGNYANRRSKGKDLDDANEAEEVSEGAAAAAGKRKREPHMTRSRKPGKKNAEVTEEDNRLEVGNGRGSRKGRSKKDVVGKYGDTIEKEVAHDAAEEDEGEDEGEGNHEGVEEEEFEVEVKERRGRGRPRKVVAEDNALQARVLRELGVRASQYSNEERKKILNKYLSKRQSRPTSGRPTKIASRQALAERRKRGDGGRFLAREGQLDSERRSKRLEKKNLKKEEEKAESKEEEIIAVEPDPEIEVVAGQGGEPKVGMVFLNEDKAYEFYVNYAGTAGFSVRKGWLDKTAKNVTKSRAYVCSKEGFRPKSVTAESKKPRPETRTGCQAHMTIKITASGKYVVTEYVAGHNHDLEAPLVDIQILRSQKLLAKVQQPPEQPKVILIPNDYKNYTRTKRTINMQLGDAQTICEYLQRMKGDNPSFFYAIQVDEDDQFTNVFWADVKSMMDYNYFGDVVCVDTRYCTRDYGRPLLLFIGVNHHKQPIIFGTAFIYDDSVESFKWLFETFKCAMSGKQPKTVLTDQSAALSDAVSSVWPGTAHRLSLLHLYLNATKILRDTFQDSETFARDFSRWLYDYEEEDDFLSSWEILSEKYNLKGNEWLSKLYEERERWALPYGHDTFCADITATLRSDNTDTILTDLLKPEIDLRNFFNNYDKFLDEKRLAEQQADYLGAQMTQSVAPLRLLWQTANSYTPTLFEMFRLEFEQISNCMVYSCGEIGSISEYQVTVKDRPRGQFVRFDSSECMVVCSCKKFEFTGLPCCHVLKILELRNIKELPPHYILKRWRKDAQSESTGANYGFLATDDDPKFSLSKRYNMLCRNLYKIAAKASGSFEASAFLESQYEQLLEQVEVLLQAKLHDKSSLSTILKGQQQNLLQNEASNSEPRRATGKKNKNAEVRRQQQSPLDSNKKKKGLLEPEEIEIPLRVVPPTVSNDITNHLRSPTNQFLAPSHIMQAPYVAQQFGLGSLQGFPGMSPFGQIQEPTPAPLQQPPHLQQPPFHSGPQIPQAPPPDIQSLQFLSSNPQLGHQTTDQGQYTIPVWDFL
ncbi:protein FAR1-RELATED SEQUENCE 12-like isoform X2 [Phragmites australis]|uniref:protein FAR1-RELATED SEQUENCE 12-like isoform X2 n=1 Tax=Phragmites australis TaxID=29695 RepID=UPI002D77D871|nr:protein FAR1-RELATED SEQUENCE 12-like isoform X2 [Phragmites australis]